MRGVGNRRWRVAAAVSLACSLLPLDVRGQDPPTTQEAAVVRGQEPVPEASAQDAAEAPVPDPSPEEPSTPTPEPLSPGPSSSDVRAELNSAVPETGAIFDVGIEDLFPQGFKDWRAEMAEKGFEFGFAYTAVFQQASGGPGQRNAAGGDVDLFGSWRLIGSPEEGAGTIFWAADNRHALFNDQTPNELGSEIGTLFDTTDGFNERDFALRQLFWQHNLLDDTLVLSAGKDQRVVEKVLLPEQLPQG